MRLVMLTIIAFTSIQAHADNICTESKLQGDTYVICSQGENNSESEARLEAIRNNNHEFNLYCDQSRQCRKSEDKRVSPKRTDCHHEKRVEGYLRGDVVVCVQLTTYEIL